jgi:hydroxymethylglutaryl-CoA synthase
MFEVDLAGGGLASSCRGPDFRKPTRRHGLDGYAPRTRRPSDFPVFSGKYSTACYLDAVANALRDLVSRADANLDEYLQQVAGIFLHRPYHLMPVQALGFLKVWGMAGRGGQDPQLRELCAEAGVALEDLAAEVESEPDLFGELSRAENAATNPYPATSSLASLLRRKPFFQELVEDKLRWGTRATMELGNLYCASLPAWVAAAFEEASESEELDWVGETLLAIGYGSGDAAEALPIYPVAGWRTAARRIHARRALEGGIDLSREQYEAMHDRRDGSGIDLQPSGEFVISRVGRRYEETFQDLGVDYYDFAAS